MITYLHCRKRTNCSIYYVTVLCAHVCTCKRIIRECAQSVSFPVLYSNPLHFGAVTGTPTVLL